MIDGLIGQKVGTTHIFNDKGRLVALTAVEAGPCFVTQIKTADRDGYDAVQVGFKEVRKLNSPEKGHLKKAGALLKHLREFGVEDVSKVQVGQKFDASIFKAGDHVDVIGVSKGKGFAGGVRRYHFRGGPKTHGQSDRQRAPGAMGSTTSPGHVWKGQRMAGHMGADRVTAINLKVVQADAERNLILIDGAIPGYRTALVVIRKSKRGK